MFNTFDFAAGAYATHITRISNLKLRFNFLKITVLQKVRTFHFFFLQDWATFCSTVLFSSIYLIIILFSESTE